MFSNVFWLNARVAIETTHELIAGRLERVTHDRFPLYLRHRDRRGELRGLA